MTTQLLQPQEIEVYYIIPTIRKHLAYALKKRGMTQKDIAKLFMVRESTVSQYFNSKRASLVSFNPRVIEELEKSAEKIKNNLDMIKETQKLLKVVRETRTLCDIHKKFSNINFDCDPYETGCLPYRRDTYESYA